jgi:D-glycero-beta-D-manno-heptose 1-phosphate adenylyltransferase
MLTPKAWGYEEEVINKDYCGKIMFVKAQYRCSIHKHVLKDEVLMVDQGCLYFETGDTPETMTGQFLQDRARINVLPGKWHRFTALRDTKIIEFSTHHEDSDSKRHCPGGKVSPDEYRSLLSNFFTYQNQDPILTIEQAKIIASTLHEDGRFVGMINGCFDILHLGHLHFIHQAKERCEILFVCCNTDEAVGKLKPGRPFNNEVHRFTMLSAIKNIDYVVACPQTTCLDAVEAIAPKVYVTTSDHGATGPEAREVLKMGGKVDVIDILPGLSTTLLAQKIASKK